MTDKTKDSLDIETVRVAMHPTRLEILGRIDAEQKGRSYASKLDEQTGIDRKIISFHLSTLENADLVSSEFDLKNEPETRPVAVRYYRLTPKGKDTLARIRALLK